MCYCNGMETYELIRSGRKTLALEITRDCRVVVRAPRRLSQARIDDFVASHAGWIARHLEQQRRRAALAPAAPKVWIVIPVLLAVAAVICFFVARSTSKAALQKKKEAENEGVVKADLDHAGIAANILAALGGKANVQKASCCATRLRFQLKDGAKVDEKALKSAGASGVIRSTPTACQVILGTQVRFVYEELQKLL